jgi:hypothetical protein
MNLAEGHQARSVKPRRLTPELAHRPGILTVAWRAVGNVSFGLSQAGSPMRDGMRDPA